ncbi:MAG: septum formation initiator family protein [Bdellovibrionota bacterium]|nr:septum formation initiator family protein [Bdellovibrionota bacterium]
MFRGVRNQIYHVFSNPKKFLSLCLGFCFFTLVFDGSIWRLYNLHKQEELLKQNIKRAKLDTEKYKGLIQKAKDPQFLRQLAREKFDWLEEDEILYIFPSER